MSKFIVYKHELNNKKYIGYTSLSLQERLYKHELNSLYGLDSYFYNAIRKYGIDKIKSCILCECDSKEEAMNKEKYYIKKYNSFKNGYNMTIGGDGGNIVGQLSDEKYNEFITKLKYVNSGKNNNRYIDVSDYTIVEHATKIYLKNECLPVNTWVKYAKENGLPQSFSKFRFDGNGFQGLRDEICKKLNIEKLKTYNKTDEHKEKLRKTSTSHRWVSNDKETIRIFEAELQDYLSKGYIRGRKKNINNND